MHRKTNQLRTDTIAPSGCICAKAAKHRRRRRVFIRAHDTIKKHLEALSDLIPPPAVLIRNRHGCRGPGEADGHRSASPSHISTRNTSPAGATAQTHPAPANGRPTGGRLLRS